jgi:hypothetical protein
MIRIILSSLFLLLAIVFGVYPSIDTSPLNIISNYLNMSFQFTTIHHMMVGTIFFVIGISISHLKSINNYWF